MSKRTVSVRLDEGDVQKLKVGLGNENLSENIREIVENWMRVGNGNWMKTESSSYGEFLIEMDKKKVQELLNSNSLRNEFSFYLREKANNFINENSLGRKILETELVTDGITEYECGEKEGKVYVISRRAAVADVFVEGTHILVPTFEIASAPSFYMKFIDNGDFSDMEKNFYSGMKALLDEEDRNVLNVFYQCAEETNNVYRDRKLCWDVINTCIKKIGDKFRESDTGHVVMSTKSYSLLRDSWMHSAVGILGVGVNLPLNDNIIDEIDKKTGRRMGLCGFIKNFEIVINNVIEDNILFVRRNVYNKMPIRNNIDVICSHNGKQLKYGVIIWEEIGLMAQEGESYLLKIE
jgi:hypothetical protein